MDEAAEREGVVDRAVVNAREIGAGVANHLKAGRTERARQLIQQRLMIVNRVQPSEAEQITGPTAPAGSDLDRCPVGMHVGQDEAVADRAQCGIRLRIAPGQPIQAVSFDVAAPSRVIEHCEMHGGVQLGHCGVLA
jgi:hypothetical protein